MEALTLFYDIEFINLGLILHLETVEKRIQKVKNLKNNNKSAKDEYELLDKLKTHLESNKLAISFECVDEDEERIIKEMNLLTEKGVIFAANVAESDLADDAANNEYVKKVKEYAKANNSEVFVLCAKAKEDLAGSSDDERQEFLDALGIKEAGIDKFIKESYRLLNLMSFLTAGEKETRAWTIKIGTKASQAPSKIHTDFEKGFIKAEVVNYQDLLNEGSIDKAKEKGLVRIEVKIILFKMEIQFYLSLIINGLQKEKKDKKSI